MTDSIIERAAKTLYETRNEHNRLIPSIEQRFVGFVEPFERLHPSSQERYRDEARAVLQAIREPSEAMTDALYDSILREYGIRQESRGRLIRMWQAPLDAALEEGDAE